MSVGGPGTRRTLIERVKNEFQDEMERFRALAVSRGVKVVSFDDSRDKADDFEDWARPYHPNHRWGSYLRVAPPRYGRDIRSEDGHRRALPSLEMLDKDQSLFGADLNWEAA